MTKEQIIKRRKALEKLIEKRRGIHSRAKSNVSKVYKKLQDAEEKLHKLRRKCEHEFPHKEPTYVGRGKCKICGHDDY